MKLLVYLITGFKSNIIRYISLIVVTIISVLSFAFFAPDILVSINDYNLYENMKTKYIWVTDSPQNSDCFCDLNGCIHLKTNNKIIECDILMQMEDSIYENNLFEISRKLDESKCSVSKNIAAKYNLHIGDNISIKENAKTYVIESFFASQSGLDERYRYDGIIVIPFSSDYVYEDSAIYYSFSNETSIVGNGIIIDLNKKKNDSKQIVISNSINVALLYLTGVVLLEIFSFICNKDYAIDYKDGMKKNKIFLELFFESLVKYSLGNTIIGLVFLLFHIDAYLIQSVILLVASISASIVVAFIISLIILWRSCYGKLCTRIR